MFFEVFAISSIEAASLKLSDSQEHPCNMADDIRNTWIKGVLDNLFGPKLDS